MREGTLAGLAMAAVVEQADAAVRAEVDLGVLEVHGTLATRAYALGQPLQRHVIAQLLTALHLGHGLALLLLFQVAIERNDGVSAQQHRDHDAHDIADIAAVVGQIGNQLHKEGKQREEDEAPDKRPPCALALLGEQPACHHQQRQGDRQAIEENAQLAGTHGRLPLRVGRVSQLAHLDFGVRDGLRGFQIGLLLLFQLLAGLVFGLLDSVKCLGAGQQFCILLGSFGRTACGHPVLERVARGLIAGSFGIVFELCLVTLPARLVGQGLRLVDRSLHALCIGIGDEMFHLQRRIGLRQIADNQAAQSDQEKAKAAATSHRPRRNHFSGNRRIYSYSIAPQFIADSA